MGRPCSYVSSLLCCISPPGCGAVMAAARVTATSPHWLKQLQRALSLVGGRISRPMGARESTWFGKQVELSRTKSRVDHLIETRNHTTAPLHSTRAKNHSSFAILTKSCAKNVIFKNYKPTNLLDVTNFFIHRYFEVSNIFIQKYKYVTNDIS